MRAVVTGKGRVRLLGLVLLAVLFLVGPKLLDLHWTGMLIEILILGLFALSVNALVGQAGMVPLGHAAFFAAGGYTSAILTVRYQQPFAISAGAGVLAAILLAIIFGFSVRTRGVYFMLLTLALGEVVWGSVVRWTSFTGGDNGIVGVEPPTVAGISFSVLSNYYYVVLAVTVAALFAYRAMVRSPFGLTLRGIRENENRMRSLGYNVVAHKFAAFVLSGAMAGLAGVLYVYWNKLVSPAAAGMLRSSEAVLMVILGGTTTLVGPFVGAALVTIIRNEASSSILRWMTLMGFVFVLTALYAPDGLLGVWKRLRQSRRTASLQSLIQPGKQGAQRV